MSTSQFDFSSGKSLDFAGRMDFGGKSSFMRPERIPSPVADVPVTDSVEDDAAAELDAVAAGFRNRRGRETDRYANATDSEFWMAVCFKTKAHRDAFIAALDIAGYGLDQFFDGHLIAKKLGVELPEL